VGYEVIWYEGLRLNKFSGVKKFLDIGCTGKFFPPGTKFWRGGIENFQCVDRGKIFLAIGSTVQTFPRGTKFLRGVY
jgi:hypothetical protein